MDGIRFVEPTVSLVDEHDLVRKVELAYRICYKSEDKISNNSKILVQRLTSNRHADRHTSPLEHAWIQITPNHSAYSDFSWMCKHNPYITVKDGHLIGNLRAFHDFIIQRSTQEGNWWVANFRPVHKLLRSLHHTFPEVFPKAADAASDSKSSYWKIEEYKEYATFHIVTSRDILQELVRHRTMSFSVESTRYCNYGNKGYAFVIPRPYEWTNNVEWDKTDSLSYWTKENLDAPTLVMIKDDLGNSVGCKYRTVSSLKAIDNECLMVDLFFSNCYLSAARYDKALQLGIKPQEARMLLPGALKTELFMTGTKNDWEKFLLLRNSSVAHPMIRYLAEKIDKILNNEAAQ